jgi:DNA polymerase elongation subunit (family B)
MDEKKTLVAAPAPTGSRKTKDQVWEGKCKLLRDFQMQKQIKPSEDECVPAFFDAARDVPHLTTSTDLFVYHIVVHNYKLFMIGSYDNYVSVALEVRNFRPFFFLPLPEYSTTQQRDQHEHEMTLALKTTKVPGLRYRSKRPAYGSAKKSQSRTDEDDEAEALDISVTAEDRLPAFGFCWLEKKRYLRVECGSSYLMSKLIQVLEAEGLFLASKGTNVKLPVYHGNWPMDTMFAIKSGISINSWVRLDHAPNWLSASDANRYTRCNMEGYIEACAVKPHPDDASGKKIRLPPLVAAFDIEQLSKKDLDLYAPSTSGTAPISKYSNFPDHKTPGDIICAIATQFFVMNRAGNPLLNVCLHVKSAEYHDTLGSRQPDVLLIEFDTERDMLRYWIRMVTESFDIDVFAGHNSIGFDMVRIVHRAAALYELEERHALSRFLPSDQHPVEIKSIKNHFGSQIEYVDLKGVTQFDTYRCALKSEKMNTYSLKELAKMVNLGQDKEKMDMPYEYLPFLYMHTDPGRRSLIYFYCAQDVEASRAVMEGRNYWNLYSQTSKLTYTSIIDCLLRGATRQGTNLFRSFVYNRGYIHNAEEQDRIHTVLFKSTCRIERTPRTFEDAASPPSYKASRAMTRTKDGVPLLEDPNADPDASAASGLDSPPSSRGNQHSGKKRVLSLTDFAVTERSKRAKVEKVAKGGGAAARIKVEAGASIPIKWTTPTTLQSFKYRPDAEKVIRESKKLTYTKADVKKENQYEGGFVKEAKVGTHKEPVATYDFASLYPSVMQAYRLCFSTFVFCNPTTGHPDRADELQYYRIQINGAWCAFIRSVKQADGTWKDVDGIIPLMEKDLVQNRKRVRDEMKVVDAEIKAHTAALALATSTADMDRLRALIYSLNSLRAVLDMNQNVCKLLCNGLYGVMASPFMEFFFKPVAITTCDVGRTAIQSVDAYLNKKYGNCLDVIYGDTDSLFTKLIRLPCNTPPSHPDYWKLVYEFFTNLEKEVNTSIPFFIDPMRMELEKIMVRMVLFCKKHYVAVKLINIPEQQVYGKVDTKKGVYTRGLVNERRDSCFFVRDVMANAYRTYTTSDKEGKELKDQVKAVFSEALQSLVNKSVPLDKFVRTVKYRDPSRYPNSAFQKVLFQELIRRGTEPTTGSRIEFIYRKGPEPERERVVEYEHMKRQYEDKKMVPDYEFYIRNQLATPMMALLDNLGMGREGMSMIEETCRRLKGFRSIYGVAASSSSSSSSSSAKHGSLLDLFKRSSPVV